MSITAGPRSGLLSTTADAASSSGLLSTTADSSPPSGRLFLSPWSSVYIKSVLLLNLHS